MAQQANINTIKKYNPKFTLSDSTKNINAYNKLFYESIARVFAYRGVFLTHLNSRIVSGQVVVCAYIFFRSAMLVRMLPQFQVGQNLYVVDDKKVRQKQAFLYKKKLRPLFPSIINSFLIKPFLLRKMRSVSCIFHVLNKRLVKKVSKRARRKTIIAFRRYRSNLFTRRLFLYTDFIKIFALFVESVVSVTFFVKILGEIFRTLPKRKHAKFLIFVKYTFKQLFRAKWPFGGIKLRINGKLRGKTRSSSFCLILGHIPTQTYSKRIFFTKQHVFTVYGAFGFKLWAYKKLKLIQKKKFNTIALKRKN